MIKMIAIALSYGAALSLAVAIVDTRPFEGPGFQTAQAGRTNTCPKGKRWIARTHECVPE